MNVIWVISDTFRKDHMGAYGNPKIHTPALDTLAAKSVRFDRHYIAAFPTMPTRADHMTGRWTLSYMQWEPFSPNEITLPQILNAKGVHTAAVVDTPFYTRNDMNYDRGFQSFNEVTGQMHWVWNKDKTTGIGEMTGTIFGGDIKQDWRYDADCMAPRTFDKAIKWLERHHKENFFLYVDTWDPHEPWEAPQYYTELYWPGFDGKYAQPPYARWPETPGITEEAFRKAHAAYCGEVTMVDTWFGHFIRAVENMGLMENTAIIFTSDHGYYFGEHGGMFGKMIFAKDKKTGKNNMGVWSHSPFYEEVTAVPLLFYVPGVKPGVYKGLTSAVDMMPTILDIMGAEVPSRVEGQSILPRVKNTSLPGRPYVISAHPMLNQGDNLRSVDGNMRTTERYSETTVTTDEWTLLYAVEPGVSELYNLKTDPKQEKNIIAQYPDKARELHQLFVKFMKDTKVQSRMMEPRLTLNL
jgi:arylsulfatase A-like enzyme